MSDMNTLLDKATILITSQSREEDKSGLRENDIPHLAEKGDSEKIGAIVRVLQQDGTSPNIRRILHYFAQSEAERGKKIIATGNREELLEVVTNIAEAFRLANEMDTVALS